MTWLSSILNIDAIFLEKLAISVFAVLLFWIIKQLIYVFITKRTANIFSRYAWSKSLGYAVFIFSALVLSRIWIKGITSLATFWGLLTAGIAIALKDIIADMAAWIFIMVRRPFLLGDRVQIGEIKGDVIDIRIFKFTILEIGGRVEGEQSTGRMVHIPNHMILSDPIFNYTRGFKYIWNEISILVTFESDWKKAKLIFNESVEKNVEKLSEKTQKKLIESSRKYLIFYSNFTPIVYTSIKESGIELTARYLCDPKEKRKTENLIFEELLERFGNEKDIDFAYPTLRYVKE